MSRTPSQMIALGTAMPAFSLPDAVSGSIISDKLMEQGAAIVIMFICNHCPYVKHINHELVNVANDYQSKGILFVAISSNDTIKHPEDGFEEMKKNAVLLNFPFLYLYDESQDVAHAFGAACTPDIFVYDADRKLVYRGQLDDSRPSNHLPVNGKDLRHALDCILNHRPVPEDQRASIGCNIKWK